VAGNTRPVPGCSSVSDCRAVLTKAGFRHSTHETDSNKEPGALVGTSPPRGGRAVPGQVVTILVSNGEDYVQPPPVPAPPAPSPTPTPDPPAEPPTLPGVPPPVVPIPLPGGGPRIVPGWPPDLSGG
jgi:beta-lactam-binding protein with PASTA domain